MQLSVHHLRKILLVVYNLFKPARNAVNYLQTLLILGETTLHDSTSDDTTPTENKQHHHQHTLQEITVYHPYRYIDTPTQSTAAHHPQKDASQMKYPKGRYSHRPFSTSSCTTYQSHHIQTYIYSPMTTTSLSSPRTRSHTTPPP